MRKSVLFHTIVFLLEMRYSEEYGIVMKSSERDMMRERHAIIKRELNYSSLGPLNLEMPKIPDKKRYILPRPTLHRKERRPPKVNILGEKLGAPKILNDLTRIHKLTEEQKRRKEVTLL